jgi:hypothetical protein
VIRSWNNWSTHRGSAAADALSAVNAVCQSKAKSLSRTHTNTDTDTHTDTHTHTQIPRVEKAVKFYRAGNPPCLPFEPEELLQGAHRMAQVVFGKRLLPLTLTL